MHFQGFSGIFVHIQPHSHVHTQGRGKGLLLSFENWKRCPDFGKKGPECVHSWIKFSIQNVVLRVSEEKTRKFFPAESYFFVLLTKACPMPDSVFSIRASRKLLRNLSSDLENCPVTSAANTWEVRNYTSILMGLLD